MKLLIMYFSLFSKRQDQGTFFCQYASASHCLGVWTSGGEAPCVRNLVSTWMCVGRFTLRPLNTTRKNTFLHLDRRLVGPKAFRAVWRRKESPPHPLWIKTTDSSVIQTPACNFSKHFHTLCLQWTLTFEGSMLLPRSVFILLYTAVLPTTAVTGWSLQCNRTVFSVRYEINFCILFSWRARLQLPLQHWPKGPISGHYLY